VNVGVLLWGLLFSSIGLGFFLYGKKQRAVVPLVCGLVLMIYPYFIPNVIALVAIGVVLTVVPYFFKS
jgi:predicted membrane protein